MGVLKHTLQSSDPLWLNDVDYVYILEIMKKQTICRVEMEHSLRKKKKKDMIFQPTLCYIWWVSIMKKYLFTKKNDAIKQEILASKLKS